MNRTAAIIVLAILLAAAVTGMALYWSDNPITRQNGRIAEGRDHYNSGRYMQATLVYASLVDTLQFASEAAQFNYANAALLASDILEKGIGNGADFAEDTARLRLSLRSYQLHNNLSHSANHKLASLASNQLGYSVIKGGGEYVENEFENNLQEGLAHFKEALKKDPGNDAARYNYELIRKIYGFSESVLAETRALVAEQKYRAAAELLENGMRRDRRLRRQQPLLDRIKAVIRIDSTHSQRIRP